MSDQNPTPTGQDEARRALATELALGIIHATGGDPKRAQEAASAILASPLAALRAPSLDRGAEEMKLRAEITCRDLVDHYREAAENHLAKRNVEKAQKAIAWADGAMACGKAIRALPVPADLNEGGGTY